MPDRGWSGFPNGRLPGEVLRVVEHALPARRHRLRPEAAASLDRLILVAQDDGHDRRITDSYRTLEIQVVLRARWCAQGKCGFAAVPGTSNHGEAEAIDNGFGFGTRSFGRWMHGNADLCREHGWVWPAWAQKPAKFEPWHWEYHLLLDRTVDGSRPARPIVPPGEEQEDDVIRRGDTGPQVEHLQRLINGVNARSARLGDFPDIGTITPDGRYDERTEDKLAHAIGRANRYTGIDLQVTDLGLVTPAMVSVLAACAADLHRRLDQTN
jgi:hypothetical protein